MNQKFKRIIVISSFIISFTLSVQANEINAINGNVDHLFIENYDFEKIDGLKGFRTASSLETPYSDELPGISSVSENDFPEESEKKRWSSFLPFKAEEAVSRGYELPLPLGISANMVYLSREVEVKDINAGINGPPVNLNQYVAIDTDNRVSSAALRFDAWIFPFLNLYVLGGNVENNTKVKATITLPPLLPGGQPNVIPLKFDADLDGSVFGSGLTLTGGYQDFFLLLDTNYSKADVGGAFDEDIEIFLYSFRSGWRGKIKNFMTNIWLGGMYWDSEREIKGSTKLENGNILNFRVTQGPAEPKNFITGVNVEFSKKIQLMLEYGFNFEDMQMITSSIAYRF